MTRPIVTLFYSYKREERYDCLKQLQELVDKLKSSFQFHHLSDINVVRLGGNYRNFVRPAMRRADIIFLLLTPHYMEDVKHCLWERQDAIELSRQGRAVVIPVLGRDFNAWQEDDDFKMISVLPRDGRFSLKSLRPEDEWKDFLEPLQTTLRELTGWRDLGGSSRVGNANGQRAADVRLHEIRRLLRPSRQKNPQLAKMKLLIDGLDDDNIAIRKEVTNGLREVFRGLAPKDLERTLENFQAFQGLIRFINTLGPEDRLPVKIAARKIQERELRDRERVFSEGLVEILCWEPTVEDVELLLELFGRATPEFQKDILRALPAGPQLPRLIEGLTRDIRCRDVQRVAMTRAGEAPK
jgi:hypothetical protein